jgi:hypothetical protein
VAASASSVVAVASMTPLGQHLYLYLYLYQPSLVPQHPLLLLLFPDNTGQAYLVAVVVAAACVEL